MDRTELPANQRDNRPCERLENHEPEQGFGFDSSNSVRSA